MKDKNTENLLKKYFNFQENCFKLPEEKQVEVFTLKTEERYRKNPKTAYIFKIAACLVVIISIVSMVLILNRDKNVFPIIDKEESVFSVDNITATPQKYFDEVSVVDGIAKWYEPNTFEVQTHFFEVQTATQPDTVSNISLMSLKDGITLINDSSDDTANVFPSWVRSAYMLNEKYISLYYVDINQVPDEYTYRNMYYDLEKGEIISLGDKMYNLRKDFFESFRDEQTNDLYWYIEEFGKSTEWCSIRIYDPRVERHDENGQIIDADREIDRYIFNIESGEIRQIPTGHIEAFASDYSYVIYTYAKGEYNGNAGRVLTIFDTKTKEEKIIATDTDSKSLDGVVFTRENDRYVLCHIRSGGPEGWDTPKARWYIYDTQMGTTQYFEGEIIYFLPEKDAIITRTPQGGRVYRLSDMTDITDSFELEVYQHYELKVDVNDSVLFMRLEPLFGDVSPVMIAENITEWVKWDNYYYIYCYGASSLLVYSLENNEMFEYDLSDTGIAERRYHYVSISVLDNGTKCSVITYYDPNLSDEPHYDPSRNGDVL